MNRRHFALLAVVGSVFLVCAISVTFVLGFAVSKWVGSALSVTKELAPASGPGQAQEGVLKLTASPDGRQPRETPRQPSQTLPGAELGSLAELYRQVNPGVVSIRVIVQRGAQIGQGAGSGFILDDQGLIVTNNHVVAEAQQITVVFYDGFQAEAEVVGTDDDSDLAIIRVDRLTEGAHALPLGDSDQIQVGDWVVAIGNPFGLGGSITAGIVSAVGRTIPSGATPFSIPQAVQTDAAINPGNSGGPLLSLRGEVIGVNAQIATGGGQGSAGVGFAIPSNVVRRVAPALIESGSYQWPWLGVTGTSVNLTIMKANDLDTQRGAYIDVVDPNGPGAEAGLKGTDSTAQVNGLQVPVGGDVVIEADGNPIASFDDLLSSVYFRSVGDKVELTVLRRGQRRQIVVALIARPSDCGG